jgi:hypothetical protein
MESLCLRRGTFSCVAASALLALLLLGCSREKPLTEIRTISGQVTHGGKPLTNAEISFIAPELGSQATVLLGPDGKYEIKAPLKEGKYQVQITPPTPNLAATGGKEKPKENPDIPKKAQAFATSGLTATVKAGKNEFNFDLKD